MALLRKAAASFMIMGAGLAATTGVASASDRDDTNVTNDSAKFLDTSDSNTLSGNAIACDIEALQLVSVEDLAASVPVELLNQKKDSPDSDVTGQSTCNPSADNKTASATDIAAN